MANLPRRQKWGDIVLERGYNNVPDTHEELAELLLEIMSSSPDPDARVRSFIDEIAETGQSGRDLLEQTRRHESYWLNTKSTVGSFNAAQRIRAMIASRLFR